MTRRPARLLGACVLAVLVLLASACQQRVGAAAFVGDQRIATAQVDGAVDEVLSDPARREALSSQLGSVRSQVVSVLVNTALLEQVAGDLGVRVGQPDLDTWQQTVESSPQRPVEIPVGLVARLQAYNAAVVNDLAEENAPPEERLRQLYEAEGLAAQGVSFADARSALVRAATQDVVSSRFAELLTGALREHPVTLNPRYGVYDEKTFQVVRRDDPAVRELEGTDIGPGEGS